MAKKKRVQDSKPLSWGVPDWCDAAGYPKAGDDLSDAEWRWEFLRRLPEYRKDWQHLAPRLRLRRGDRSRLLPASNPVLAVASKYGLLYGLPDPRQPHGKAKPVFVDAYRFAQTQWSLSVPFDLRRPLGPQLKDAETYLRHAQRLAAHPLEREHRDLWPTYLRLLDAADARQRREVTWQQAGESLLPLFGRIRGPESRNRRGKKPLEEPRKKDIRLKERTGTPAASDAHNRHADALALARRLVLGQSPPLERKRRDQPTSTK